MLDIQYRDKIVAWLKAKNCYAVLHDGHFGRYFHIRTLDKSCESLSLTNEIYSAFLESYDCEFEAKGTLVADYKFHLDAKWTWEFFYRRIVLGEDVSEVRLCEVCGKALSEEEYYRCAEHAKNEVLKGQA